jgi:hypothetical protein
MLGLFLIYFIGKQFHNLAEEYKKNKWAYAILGVVMYYVGTFMGGAVTGLVCYLIDKDFGSINNLLLSLMAVPFGLFTCWLTYSFLKRKLMNIPSDNTILDDTILDDGMM